MKKKLFPINSIKLKLEKYQERETETERERERKKYDKVIAIKWMQTKEGKKFRIDWLKFLVCTYANNEMLTMVDLKNLLIFRQKLLIRSDQRITNRRIAHKWIWKVEYCN